MLDSVICASCGAKVREDRVRCLRCGSPLVAAAAEHARRSAVLGKILATGGGIAAAALIGLVALRPSSAGARDTAVLNGPGTAPTRAAGIPPQQPVVRPVTSRDAIAPGQVAYASGDMTGALESFQRAVALAPDDPDGLNNLGQVLVRVGRAREALPYFDRAIAAVPGSWAYRFNRARAFAELEQWSQAVAGYRDALQLFPDDYATHFNLAKALQRTGDLDGAIRGFERAIELGPDQPDFHLSHGLALEAAQRPRDAAAAYRRYLELADDAPEADKVKGRVARLEGAPAAPR